MESTQNQSRNVDVFVPLQTWGSTLTCAQSIFLLWLIIEDPPRAGFYGLVVFTIYCLAVFRPVREFLMTLWAIPTGIIYGCLESSWPDPWTMGLRRGIVYSLFLMGMLLCISHIHDESIGVMLLSVVILSILFPTAVFLLILDFHQETIKEYDTPRYP